MTARARVHKAATERTTSEGTIRAIVLINLGYGDRSRLHSRSPRFVSEAFCRME